MHSIYEQKLVEAVDEEKSKMHQEFTEQLEDQVQVIKEQSDQVIELRTNEIELQYELKHNNLRNEVLEELRSERELKMKRNLKEKLEKRLTEEISQKLRGSLETEIRKQMTGKITEELKSANSKELTQMRRKLQASQQTKKEKLVSQ